MAKSNQISDVQRVLATLEHALTSQTGELLTFRSDGHGWQQVGEVPQGMELLVRAVGTLNVEQITNGLRDYVEAGHPILYYAAGRRKDELRFYVEPAVRGDVTAFLKARTRPVL